MDSHAPFLVPLRRSEQVLELLLAFRGFLRVRGGGARTTKKTKQKQKQGEWSSSGCPDGESVSILR